MYYSKHFNNGVAHKTNAIEVNGDFSEDGENQLCKDGMASVIA